MATISSNGSGGGLWSAGATWNGGTKPTTDDDAVIVAGDVVTVDESTSVLTSCLVQSHASTPGTLRFMDGYSGTLNIKSGAVATNRLQGNSTSATCRGRVLANQSGLWTGSTDSATLMASQLGTTGAVSDGTGAKRIFTPTTSPAWVVDALIGESMTINGDSAGTITRYQDSATKRVLTPNPSPSWTVDALIGLNMCVNGKTYAVEDNDATTATLTTGPPIGDNVSSWGLIYPIEDNDATTVTLTTGPAIAATVTSWRLITRPLPVDHRATIALGALSSMVTQYLDVLLHCYEPTYKCVRTYGKTETFVATDHANENIELPVGVSLILTTNTPVYLSTSGTIPTGLSTTQMYYVRGISGTKCKLSTTASDVGLVTFSDAGTGIHTITTGIIGVASIASNIITTDVAALPTTPWAALQCVMFTSTGTYPTGIEPDRAYWIKVLSGGTITIMAYPNASMSELTLGTTWSGTLRAYLGATFTTQDTIAVLDDVTADPAWAATGDTSTFATCTTLSAAVLADEGPVDYDQQRVAVKVLAPTFITLSEVVDSAQYPNSRLWLMSRNVEITSETTTDIDIVNASTGVMGVYGCSVRSRPSTGVTFKGYGVNNPAKCIISGTISGTLAAVGSGSATTAYDNIISGTIAASTRGMQRGLNNIVSGTIVGCGAAGIDSANVPTITGTISGCTTALFSCTGGTMSGIVRGCTTGVSASKSVLVSGTIQNCATAIGTSNPHPNQVTGTITDCYTGLNTVGLNFVSGTIKNCVTATSYTSMVCYGATLEGNYADVTTPYHSIAYATSHKSTIQAISYKYSSTYFTSPLMYHLAYDLPSALGVAQPGFVGCWNPGGYTKTTALVTGTHGTPPRIPPAGIHVTICEDNNVQHLVEFPLKGTTARPVRVIICASRKSGDTFDQYGTWSIDDPGKALTDSSRVLTSWVMTAADGWQQTVLSYQPTYERDLILRMLVRGGSSTGSGSDKTLYWFQVIEDEDTSRPRTRIGVAPTR